MIWTLEKTKIVGSIHLHVTLHHQFVTPKVDRSASTMQQFDLVLKHALVNGAFNADIGVKNGLITALGLGLASTDDTEVIDCKGAVVTPGGIDGHVHLAQDQSPRAKEAGYRCADNSMYTSLDHSMFPTNCQIQSRLAREAPLLAVRPR
jgi:imidazolonepropionase-like amidohydrolase